MVRKISLLLGVLLIVMVSGFVSAQYSGGYFDSWGTQGFIDSITRALEPILIALFGGQDYTGYLLFEKLLLFILVSVFAYLALSNFPFFDSKNKHLARLIAIIVALLGIRNLDYLWFNTIFTQYAVLFVAIAGILPFVIYWFFLKDMEPMVRKIGWVFFAIVYFGLWITTEVDAHEEVYLIAALASLGYAFFLDAAVHRWLAIQEAKKGDNTRKASMVASLRKDIDEAREHNRQRRMDKKDFEQIEKKKLELIKHLLKN
jgi:hypothetical protein